MKNFRNVIAGIDDQDDDDSYRYAFQYYPQQPKGYDSQKDLYKAVVRDLISRGDGNYTPYSTDFIDRAIECYNYETDMRTIVLDSFVNTYDLIHSNVRQSFVDKGDLSGLEQYDRTMREIDEEVERRWNSR